MSNLNQEKEQNLIKKSKIKNLKRFSIFLFPLILLIFGIYFTASMKGNVVSTTTLLDANSAVQTYNQRQSSTNDKLRTAHELLKTSDSLQNELIIEVEKYMRKYNPNTKLSAENIVNLCLQYQFDIPLLLSQAQLETHFGRSAGKRNSVFGVISRKYTHVDESVEDYIKIMKKSYVKTRTPEECIAANFYVEGSRKYKYAGSSTYGKTIGKIRTNIIKNTSIQDLYRQIEQVNQLAYEYQVETLNYIDTVNKTPADSVMLIA